MSACTKTVTQVQQVDQAFSAIYTLNPSGWATSDGGLSFSTTLSVPELDNDIQDHGAVVIFDGISYGSVHAVGQVFLDLHAVSGAVITAPGGTILAKVVLVHATNLP